MSNVISLLEISSSNVEGPERILLHNNIKKGQLTREYNCVHRNCSRLLEDLIPKDYKDIDNEKFPHRFYINVRVVVYRIRMVSNKIGFRMTYSSI